MEKTIYTHKQGIGSDGAAEIGLGTVGQKLRLEAKAYVEKDINEIVEKVMGPANQFVDKLEQWIPGDQKAEAELMKTQLRKALVNALIGAIPENEQPQIAAAQTDVTPQGQV